MKRIITYISALAAALSFTSCASNLDFSKGEENVLKFTARSSELQTKTGGDDAYNENTINTVDWFFFQDEEGKVLLHQEHSVGPNLRLETTEGSTYADLRHKSYLYAVANITLPAAPEGGWTLEKLLAIPVQTQFTKTATDDEGDEGQVIDKGNFDFIMDTYDETRKGNKYLQVLSPSAVDDETTTPITVDLSRLAVKISTKIKIQKTVATTDNFGNKENWTPILTQKDFDVYMVDALKAGYLSGEPVRRADATDEHITGSYFTYGRNLATVEELAAEDNYYVWQTVDPFYTYPQTWNGEDNREPFIKIIFPWMSDVKGSSEFHYKIVLPEPVDGVFTLSRNCWYQVTATIKVLGGTENDYVLVDDVLYGVADWADPSWESGTGLSSPIYFLVPTTTFHIYSTDEFNIPYYCDDQSTVKAYFTMITYNDYSGASTAVRTANYEGQDNTTVTPSGGSGQSRWEDTHSYSVTVGKDEADNKVVKFTHSMADVYVVREIHLTIYKNESKSAEVTIYQHPAIELKKQGAGDVFVNGHFARLSTNPGFGTTKTIDGVNYYHSRNGWSNNNRIADYNNNQGRYGYGTITDGSNVDETISTDWYTTDITVTAFSETNNYYTANNTKTYYKIADPRVKASVHYGTGWSLDPYLTGEQRTSQYGNTYNDVTSNWTNPSDILISSQAEVDRPKIAPRFLVSSALNANTGLSWNQVIRRAATYQEAGYPAGRWRLPTEAEMAFIVARQKDGTIPNLYATNTTYWAGSGRVLDMISSTATNLEFRNRTTEDNMSVRFVYDLWYWGDQPVTPTYQYHANQHIESN